MNRATALSRVLTVALSAALFTTTLPAAAQVDSYPSKPIRLLVPYPPGGSPDLIARALSAALAGKLGQPIVVENRAGASGMVATEAVARSAADGYTLLLGSDGPVVITPLLKGESPDAPGIKLAPVALLADSAFVLLGASELPAKDLPTLFAYGRLNPGKLTFGSSGIGSQHHLAGLMLARAGQMNLVHVPYKGFGEAAADVTAGRVDLLFGSVPAGVSHVNSRRLKALAVTGPSRSSLLPEVPTASEQGFPTVNVTAWFGVLAPSETPAPIVAKLDEAIRGALNSEALKASLRKLGLNVLAGDPTSFARRIQQDRVVWGDIIKASGVKTSE